MECYLQLMPRGFAVPQRLWFFICTPVRLLLGDIRLHINQYTEGMMFVKLMFDLATIHYYVRVIVVCDRRDRVQHIYY